MPKIICGIDESESSRSAAQVTAALAAAPGRHVVLPPKPSGAWSSAIRPPCSPRLRPKSSSNRWSWAHEGAAGFRRRFSAASPLGGRLARTLSSADRPPGGRIEPGPLVCAVDESPEARNALRVARCLRDALDVDLVLAYAVPDSSFRSVVWGARAQLARHDRARAEELLAGLASCNRTHASRFARKPHAHSPNSSKTA